MKKNIINCIINISLYLVILFILGFLIFTSIEDGLFVTTVSTVNGNINNYKINQDSIDISYTYMYENKEYINQEVIPKNSKLGESITKNELEVVDVYISKSNNNIYATIQHHILSGEDIEAFKGLSIIIIFGVTILLLLTILCNFILNKK